jgi:hypothetical protein
VLRALPEEVLRDTLVVLTADHGEELFDHGGWKHGHTLYEEQVRVPFLLRWDRRLAPGRRPGEVALLDLAPTILSAAGAPVPPELPGADLMPALRGERALPARPVLAQRLSFGPLLAGVVAGGWKLVVYNEREPFAPADELQRATFALDARRLERLALFDLAADPRELRNLAHERPDKVAELAPDVLVQLGRELPGLRVSAGGGATGKVLRAEIVFERAPEGWWPELLSLADRVELDGSRLVVELVGEELAKSVRVLGATGAVESIVLQLDGVEVASPRVALGSDPSWDGGRVPEAALSADRSPAACAADDAHFCLWRPRAPAADRGEIAPDLDRETRERLRALGYLGATEPPG